MASPFVSISFRDSDLALLAQLTPAEARKAMYQAVKVMARKGRVRISKRVRQELNLKKDYVDKIVVANKPSYEDPVARVTVKSTLVPLSQFVGANWTKGGGVSVKMGKKGKAQRFRHMFLANVASAKQAAMGVFHKGFFYRSRHLPTKGPNVGKPGMGFTKAGRVWRLAIEEGFGPSPLDIMGQTMQKQVGQEELAALHAELTKTLQSKIEWQLDKRKRNTPQPTEPAE